MIDLIYTLGRYGAKLSPQGGAYNFPPYCCFPPFILLALVGPWALISRLRVAVDVVLGMAMLTIGLSVVVIISVLSDLTVRAGVTEAAAVWFAVVLAVIVAMLTIPIHRWSRQAT